MQLRFHISYFNFLVKENTSEGNISNIFKIPPNKAKYVKYDELCVASKFDCFSSVQKPLERKSRPKNISQRNENSQKRINLPNFIYNNS